MSSAAVAPFHLERIGQIQISVDDIARAERFYGDTLGLRHLFSFPPRLAFFDAGGVQLMLDVPEAGRARATGSILYFMVDDVEAAHAALRERGVVFDEGPRVIARMGASELWMAFFRDSEQNLLAVMAAAGERT